MSSTEGVIIVDNATSGGSVPGSPNKNKMKFFCSHGGKILPRPDNGFLKYVGGETRVISVSRDIEFQELMKKLTYLIEGEMVLKYQLMAEDLDALVTVKTDEDLRHMFDEYDRHESTGTLRFRAFLFPAHPIVIQNNHGKSKAAIEQRYVDAINGIVRTMAAATASRKQHQVLDINPNGSPVISSSSTSPTSPESNYTEAKPPLLQNRRGHMHRVQSSPTIYNHQISPNYSNQLQKHNRNHYQSSTPMIDLKQRVSSRPERLISVRSFGRIEGVRYQVDHSPSQHYYYSKHAGDFRFGYSKCTHFDEYASCSSDWRMERPRSLSPSPLSLSPRNSNSHTHIVHKVFEA